jgi:hypothetical protein
MPSQTKLRTDLAAHRAHQLHDILVWGPEYRRLLDLACALYDAWQERQQAARKGGRPKKLKSLKVHARKAA